MTVARQLAEFLSRTTVTDLPSQAFDYAAMLIASTIASAAAGRRIESARIVRDLAIERGGRAEASVWFDPKRAPAVADAAQVNAVMSDAAASDDSDLRNIVHAGTPCTAASLLAERDGASGEAVLAAIVCGYEAAGRIGEAITPGFRQRGFHGCHGAVFAAAVAAARLLRLDTAQMTRAIALSATSIGGWQLRRTRRSRASTTPDLRHAWRQRGAGGAARLPVRGTRAGDTARVLRSGWWRRWRDRSRDRNARSGCELGHLHRHGDQASARRAPVPRDRRGRRQRGA